MSVSSAVLSFYLFSVVWVLIPLFSLTSFILIFLWLALYRPCNSMIKVLHSHFHSFHNIFIKWDVLIFFNMNEFTASLKKKDSPAFQILYHLNRLIVCRHSRTSQYQMQLLWWSKISHFEPSSGRCCRKLYLNEHFKCFYAKAWSYECVCLLMFK